MPPYVCQPLFSSEHCDQGTMLLKIIVRLKSLMVMAVCLRDKHMQLNEKRSSARFFCSSFLFAVFITHNLWPCK